jgi:hypothetical protein
MSYGKVTRAGSTVRVDATNEQLDAWARRPGRAWPCSTLARYARIVVELDDGDLADLAAYLPGARYAEDSDDVDIDARELDAWLADIGA